MSFIISVFVMAFGLGAIIANLVGCNDAAQLERENHDLKADLATARHSIQALIEAGDAIIEPQASRWTATQTEQEARIVDLTAYRLDRLC